MGLAPEHNGSSCGSAHLTGACPPASWLGVMQGYMSHSLNPLKGAYTREYIGD